VFFGIIKNIVLRSLGVKPKINELTFKTLLEVESNNGKVEKGMEILVQLLN
jgi:hypothetical protein